MATLQIAHASGGEMAPTMTSTEPRSHDLEAPRAPHAPERLETREWLATRISRNVALTVAVAWYVLFLVGVSLEPEATHPEAMPEWIGIGVEIVLLSFLAVMVAGLAARRRWGLVASMGAAAVFVAASVACPVSGHHGFGAWWYGQMACALGLVAVSAAALRRA
jgi:hypothetical protein